MKRLVALVALGAVSLTACASDPDYHASTSFAPEERQAIVTGRDWLEQASRRPIPTILFDLDDETEAVAPRQIRRGADPAQVGAYGTCSDGVVYLGPIDLKYLPGLTAHEMAHCTLGLRDHDHPTDGIMGTLYPMRWTENEERDLHR